MTSAWKQSDQPYPSDRSGARPGRVDGAVCFVAAVVALACWWPTRTLPVHWDASVVVDRARRIHESHFADLTESQGDFAHPPLIPALLALAMAVFGDDLGVLHVALVWALPVVLVFTYLLGRDRSGRVVGAVAASVMLTAPVTLEEVGQLYLDLPLCAFVTVGVWAWTTRRTTVAGIAFGLAVMTKLPALVVPLAIVPFQLADPSRRRALRMYIALAIPFVVTAAWLAYHAQQTGWLLSRPGRVTYHPSDLAAVMTNVAGVGYWFFGAQGRGLAATMGAVALCVVLVRRRAAQDRGEGAELAPTRKPFSFELLALAGIPVAALAAFVFFGEVAERYGLFVYPCFFVTVFTLVADAARVPLSRARAGVVAGVTCLAGLAVLAVELWRLHPRRQIETTFDSRPEEDLGARDMIAVGQKAARWVRANYPVAHVYGSFPESYQLTEPGNGYVDAPVWFAKCAAYAPQPGITDLVYIHRYASGQAACKMLSDSLKATPLKLFVVNGHWIEVRRLSAP